MVRTKYRYFLSEIIPIDPKFERLGVELPLRDKDIAMSILKAVERIYGDYGKGCVRDRLSVRMFNCITRVFVLRVRRGPHVLIAASMPFVTNINGIKVSIKTLRLSGTIRSSMKFLLRHDIKQMDIFMKTCKSEEQQLKVQRFMSEARQQLSGDGRLST